MDTTPIPGFITRKTASENCKRSERTLQRYWSAAIEQKDDTVLPHLKLRTEDGEVVEGPTVTKELIDELKKRRKNPTWYVHASWVQKTYGPRLDPVVPQPDTRPSRPPVDLPSSVSAPQQTHVGLLEQRIRDLERDKDQLQGELKIKNDQIHQANERSRESHVLMRDLHDLLREVHRQLPAAARPIGSLTVSADAEPVMDAPVAEQGSRPSVTPRPVRTRPAVYRPRKVRATAPIPKPARAQPEGLFAKHTPTFHKALSRLLHRP